MVASRAGAAIQRPETLLHHHPSQIFRAVHPGSFGAAYVIGIATDGLFGCRVPTVPHAAGRDSRP